MLTNLKKNISLIYVFFATVLFLLPIADAYTKFSISIITCFLACVYIWKNRTVFHAFNGYGALFILVGLFYRVLNINTVFELDTSAFFLFAFIVLNLLIILSVIYSSYVKYKNHDKAISEFYSKKALLISVSISYFVFRNSVDFSAFFFSKKLALIVLFAYLTACTTMFFSFYLISFSSKNTKILASKTMSIFYLLYSVSIFKYISFNQKGFVFTSINDNFLNFFAIAILYLSLSFISQIGIEEFRSKFEAKTTISNFELKSTESLLMYLFAFISMYITGIFDLESMITVLIVFTIVTFLESSVNSLSQDKRNLSSKLFEEKKIDQLTKLYSRGHFINLLETRMQEKKKPFYLIVLDINRFKVINDLHGHVIGDIVLQVLSSRLRQFQNEKTMFARFSGDEFAVFYEAENEEEAIEFTNQIYEKLTENIRAKNHEISLSISMGISKYPEHAEQVLDLIKHAAIALHNLKKLKKGGANYSTSEMYEVLKRRNFIEFELSNIKYDKEFVLNYQPQINSKSEKVEGIEVLSRWYHPVEGFISPVEFISVAEEADFIQKMTDWVLNTALSQYSKWEKDYGFSGEISINISAKSLNDNEFIENLKKTVKRYKVNPRNIILELTEHSVISSVELAEIFFEKVRELGVKISIDDFGTGFSSINYLRKFPIDELKIDKELIDNIENKSTDYTIIKTISELGFGLNLKIVAEGVENENQVKILRDIKCSTIQGYFYSKPLTAEDFEDKYLRN